MASTTTATDLRHHARPFRRPGVEALEILDKGHYDVKLSPEELHRLTLWMDCCSIFYGVYEKEGGEAQLRGEVVQPTLQ